VRLYDAVAFQIEEMNTATAAFEFMEFLGGFRPD
jgi:hypothetical protein